MSVEHKAIGFRWRPKIAVLVRLASQPVSASRTNSAPFRCLVLMNPHDNCDRSSGGRGTCFDRATSDLASPHQVRTAFPIRRLRPRAIDNPRPFDIGGNRTSHVEPARCDTPRPRRSCRTICPPDRKRDADSDNRPPCLTRSDTSRRKASIPRSESPRPTREPSRHESGSTLAE